MPSSQRQTVAPCLRPAGAGFPPLLRGRAETLQVNLGRLCNQACRHCHVDSSPARGGAHENAQDDLVAKIATLLRLEPDLRTLDLTGGAPELNPRFRGLVVAARRLGRRVLVRHNLTVQEEPGQQDLPEFFAREGVVLFCPLPCYQEANVERQRGHGVFEKSIAGLRRLNAAGFGDRAAGLELNLVYNPAGPSLPPPQERLEADYRRELADRFGIRFDALIAIANQPIYRFREDLERQGRLDEYQRLLEDHFNPATLPRLMCRSQLSVRWDGQLYDCDFDLVVDLPLRDRSGRSLMIDDLLPRPGENGGSRLRRLEGLPIATASHCFACTAGAGSSCGGALA